MAGNNNTDTNQPSALDKKEFNFYRRPVVSLIVLVVLVAVGLWFWQGRGPFQQKEQVQAHIFTGNIREAREDSLIVDGYYVLDNEDEISNQERVIVEVLTTPQTRFEKTTVFLPTDEELEETGGVFFAGDLRHETAAGSVEDFASTEGLGVNVTAAVNIWGKARFEAQKIEYTIQVNPGVETETTVNSF